MLKTKDPNPPYSLLLQNETSYKIMLLHEQEGRSFRLIGEMIGLSSTAVGARYSNIKRSQMLLYCKHLAYRYGNSFEDWQHHAVKIYNCYMNYTCVSAHFEREYGAILTAYRNGEPGLPEAVLKQLPPYRDSFGGKTVSTLVRMREQGGMTYAAIAKRLRITEEKARHLYRCHYGNKARKLMDRIERETGSSIRHEYYRATHSPRQRYEQLCRDYPKFAE